MSVLRRLRELGNKHRWLSFVSSILFVGLALLQVSIDNVLSYILIVPLVLLGTLTVATFNPKRNVK